MALVPLLSEPNYSAGGLSFLQIVQRLQRESSTSGAAIATTVGQTGDIKRLVDWASTAWMDIQNDRTDWMFLRQPMSFLTTAGKQSYAQTDIGVVSFGNFKRDSFRQYSTTLGFGSEQRLAFLPYDSFRDLYLYGTQRTATTMPVTFTIDPQKNFLLGPSPDGIYNVNGEVYALPTEMALDADRPAMPAQYHMAIVWRALMYYGQFEAAPEAYSHGQNEYMRLMNRLYGDQLPMMTFGAPLA